MSEAENGTKRFVPGMTRGSFRLQFVLWSIWTLLQLVTVVGNLVLGTGQDAWDYLYLAALLLGLVALGFLLYVRHRDSRFWEEDEAKSADWERRGRAL